MCHFQTSGGDFLSMIMQAKVNEITFTDADIVNIGNWIPAGESNPHSVVPYLFHDHGFVVAVVFASNLSNALDIAADADKLDRYLIADKDLESYGPDAAGISYLGNANEPFDIESLHDLELPNPPRSFVAQFNLAFGEIKCQPNS